MPSLQPKTLISTGLLLLALRNVLQWLVDRGGHATNSSDFLLGALFGVAAALTLTGIWRSRRGSRCTGDPAVRR